ncbi:hypothetical protein J6590_074638 [Homalodisca vitripennis]|nr:hypothetical protein J6590_074638 [Homalodisca vitripennis]
MIIFSGQPLACAERIGVEEIGKLSTRDSTGDEIRPLISQGTVMEDCDIIKGGRDVIETKLMVRGEVAVL